MKKVVLNGVDLSIEDVVKVARGGGAAGGAAEQGGASGGTLAGERGRLRRPGPHGPHRLGAHRGAPGGGILRWGADAGPGGAEKGGNHPGGVPAQGEGLPGPAQRDHHVRRHGLSDYPRRGAAVQGV